MSFSIRSIFKFAFVSVSLILSIEGSYALPANETRAAIVTPFPFLDGAAPQNILDEMNIENDLPQLTLDYFQKIKAFKSVSLVNSETEADLDIYIKGEILHTSGGNGAARYWGGIAGAGRSSLVVRIKVYGKDSQLLHEGIAHQSGSRGGTIFSVWSNRKNITTAMNAIPKKIFLSTLAGDMTTAEGIVRALESSDPIAIQAGAKSSSKHNLFLNESVTDSMEKILLKTLKGSIENIYYIDGAAWCAINLGDSSNKKYISTLEKVVSSEAHKKIKKHAKKALRELREL